MYVLTRLLLTPCTDKPTARHFDLMSICTKNMWSLAMDNPHSNVNTPRTEYSTPPVALQRPQSAQASLESRSLHASSLNGRASQMSYEEYRHARNPPSFGYQWTKASKNVASSEPAFTKPARKTPQVAGFNINSGMKLTTAKISPPRYHGSSVNSNRPSSAKSTRSLAADSICMAVHPSRFAIEKPRSAKA